MRCSLLFSALLAGVAAVAHGQTIFKCSDDSGAIVFSETPCATDAEVVDITDSQGISNSRSYYESPIYPSTSTYPESPTHHQAQRNKSVDRNSSGQSAARDEARRIAKIQKEAEREFEKVLRRGGNTKAAQRAANVTLSQIDNPRGKDAQREYNRMIKKGYNSKAAERAANVVLGRPSAPDSNPEQALVTAERTLNHPPVTPKPPAVPIPSTRGGFYVPTSPDGSQYIPPSGAGICNKEGPNLNCSGVVKPANGVVVEPPHD